MNSWLIKIEDIVKRGTFKSKGEFVKSAMEDMIRRWETEELTTKMDKFAEDMAGKHPGSVSEAVLRAREEEEILGRIEEKFQWG